jgi:hypothetical protein
MTMIDPKLNIVRQIAPRVRAAVGSHAVGLAAMARPGAEGRPGDVDALLLVGTAVTQRLRLRLDDGRACNVFVENAGSAATAIERGLKDHVVRLLAEATVVFDESGELGGLRLRAIDALAKPCPSSPAATLRAMCEPADLLRDLEQHRDEPIVAQLLYGELLAAMLRARLAAAQQWAVPPADLFAANRRIDAGFAAWVAIAARRQFAPEMLPAIRRHVQDLVDRFDGTADIVTIPSIGGFQRIGAPGAPGAAATEALRAG